MMRSTLTSAAALALVAASASAAVVVQYDTTSAAGNEPAINASTVTANANASTLARGAGLAASAAGGSLNSTGWTGEATDFVGFSFTIDAGFEADLTNFTMTGRSSNTGPGTVALLYSLDGFSTAGTQLGTFAMSGTNNTIVDISLASLTDLAGTVSFRLMASGTNSANGGTTATAGTFRVITPTINGDVTLTPAPGSVALLGLGGLIVARRRRA